jgi:hypothetical protein
MRCLILLISVAMAPLALVANSASARDFHVNNVFGDNQTNGINRALRVCDKGDRIILANTGVPYREMLALSAGKHWGYRSLPLTIVGNGAILDGTAEVPPRAWEHIGKGVFRFQPGLISHQQLYLDGKPATRRAADPTGRLSLKFEPLEWMLFEGAILFRPEDGRLPDEYALTYAKLQTGITLYHVRHVRIENLIVQGFELDGINAHDGCYDVILTNVTARGNGRSGMTIAGSSQVIVRDSLIGDNGRAQLRVEGYSTARLEQSEIVANTAPAFEITGGKLFIDGQQQEQPGEEKMAKGE